MVSLFSHRTTSVRSITGSTMAVRTISVRTMAVCILACLLTTRAYRMCAQDNIYKIDNRLYPIFMRAMKNSDRPEGLLSADTLSREATRLGDRKAMCLAASIPLLYYNKIRDNDRMEAAAERCKDISTRTGYLQYYYFAYSYQVSRLIRENKIPSAMQQAKAMQQHAAVSDNKYGIMTSMRLLGRIYYMRGNITMALNSYRQALDYQIKYVPDQDLSQSYRNIATCLRMQGRSNEAYESIENGLKLAKTPASIRESLREKCVILFDLERQEEFDRTYKEYMDACAKYGFGRQDEAVELQLCEALLDNDYAKARELCDKIPIKLNRMKFRQIILSREGNFRDAYYMALEQRRYRDSLLDLGSASSLNDMELLIEREKQKQELLAMHLENTRLQHNKTEMELERTNMQMELDQTRLKNQQQELDYQKIKSQREIERAEKEKIKADIQARTYIRQKKISVIIIAGLLLTFIISFGIRQYFIRQLRRKNAELDQALQMSMQAEQMKSLFIQNISHEIRTPLNAIVGFSQLLTSPDYLSDDEDRLATCNIINQKSTLLTSLINDILLLSQLESGEYKMEMTNVPCNYLCNTTLATMELRMEKQLRLYYTTDADDSYMLYTSKECVEKILFALIENAIKVTEKGEVNLQFSLTENPGYATFAVADTGPGIPEGHDEIIFERFFKLKEGDQSKGLGLCISRAMANCVGAVLRLDRKYTRGARFVFIVPVKPQEDTTAP